MAGVNLGDPFPWVTQIAIGNPGGASPTNLFVASYRMYRSTDNGSSWSLISNSLTGDTSNTVSTIHVTPFGGALFVYTGSANGRIFRCDDAAAASPVWVDVTNNYPGGRVSRLAADPTNPMRVFLTRGSFGASRLYRSTNGGGTWSAMGSGLPNVPANAVVVDPLNTDRVFVGMDTGIYVSEDGGSSFIPFMNNLPLGAVVTDLEIDDAPYVLSAGTYGVGAWQVMLNAITASAGGDVSICLTESVQLDATVANPSPPLNFAWQVLSGPDVSPSQFSFTDVEDPIFTPTAAGDYVLEFEVSGASGTSSDTLVVTVGDPALFTQTQRSTWRLHMGDPGWNADVDIDGNQMIDLRDLILAIAGVYCL